MLQLLHTTTYHFGGLVKAVLRHASPANVPAPVSCRDDARALPFSYKVVAKYDGDHALSGPFIGIWHHRKAPRPSKCRQYKRGGIGLLSQLQACPVLLP